MMITGAHRMVRLVFTFHEKSGHIQTGNNWIWYVHRLTDLTPKGEKL